MTITECNVQEIAAPEDNNNLPVIVVCEYCGTEYEWVVLCACNQNEDLITCEYCGNHWDGNAQCPCYGGLFILQEEEEEEEEDQCVPHNVTIIPIDYGSSTEEEEEKEDEEE